jgi:hypothetical protein
MLPTVSRLLSKLAAFFLNVLFSKKLQCIVAECIAYTDFFNNFYGIQHRLDRVLSFLYIVQIGTLPHPHTQASVFPPPPPPHPTLGPGGGHTRLRERGGGPNSNEGADTVVL